MLAQVIFSYPEHIKNVYLKKINLNEYNFYFPNIYNNFKLDMSFTSLLNEQLQKNKKVLTFSFKDLDESNMKQLAQIENGQLIELNLGWNKINLNAAMFLKKGKWPNLKEINLHHNNLGDKGVKYLSNANWDQLQVIWLSHNRIGNEGMIHLMKNNWTQLKTLGLGYNKISNFGLSVLIKGNWINLQDLQLFDNNFDFFGAFFINLSEYLKLCYLRLCQFGQIKRIKYFLAKNK